LKGFTVNHAYTHKPATTVTRSENP